MQLKPANGHAVIKNQQLGDVVAEDASKTPSPFDVRTIKYLVGLMSQHDLSEIDLREGDLRIRLRRGAREVLVSPPIAAPPASPPAPAPSSSATPPAPLPQPAAHVIKSPTPGTFYSAARPDAEPFVRVGLSVTPTPVTCLIEATKNFN